MNVAVPPVRDSRRVTVFLCGDASRGDDAVAFAVAAALSTADRPWVDLIEVGGLDTAHLLALAEGQSCIVVDAVAGPEPGEAVEMPLADVAALGRGDASFSFPARTSSHAMPLPAALQLAQLLRGSPVRGAFLGVGIAGCAFGAPLSAPVAAAVPALARTLGRTARELAALESLAC
jgi:hydrogenase maturation protease